MSREPPPLAHTGIELPCTQCGMLNPSRFRFCGACGQRLGEPAPARAPDAPKAAAQAGRERRQLTVLFCDLAGSTSLSTRLDAEDLGEVIHQYFTLCKARFEQHGGFVDREQGDCLRVYFGYPQAHDDDPSRAARAALEVSAAVRQLGAELHARVGGPLEVHIGLHTGEVVAGEIGSGGAGPGPLVVGEVPNVAKRLEEQAGAGQVLISAATRRLIEPGFACEALGALELKGLPDAVEAYRLLADRGFAASIERLGARSLTPLLGRDAELAALDQRWAQAREGRGQVVLLGGEPGIGKSRLLHAFVSRIAAARAPMRVMQCQQQFAHSALFPLVDLLRRQLGLQRGDTAALKRAKLDAAFASAALPEPAAVERVAALLSLPVSAQAAALPPRRQRALTFEWLLCWLADGDAAQAQLLVLEDAHWADASTLAWLGAAIERIAAHRVLLIVSARPEFVAPWPERAEPGHIGHITLQRLSAQHTRALVRRIAAGRAAAAALVEQIAERSDGVPLYVEELTAMLLQGAAIASGQPPPPSPGPPQPIPPTLRGSLMARLDQLGAAKPLAQVASVLGREFSYRLLRLVSGNDDAGLRAGLGALIDAGLMYPLASGPDAGYAFKHVLVQEAAYLSLLKSQRAQFHERTAGVLLQHFGELAGTHPEIVALHCAAAGQHREAAEHWYRAGALALEASADAEAVAHLKLALQQLAALPAGAERSEREVGCLITLGSAMAEIRGYGATEVEEIFGRVYRLCAALGDSDALYSALTGLHAFYQVRGQLDRAIESGRGLVRIAAAHGDPLRRAQAHRCLGWSLLCSGDFRRGGEQLRTVLALFDRRRAAEHSRIHGMHPWVAGFANSSLLQWFVGDADTALQHARQALELARELRHPLALAYALTVSAALHTCRDAPALALQCVDEVQALAAGAALPYWVAWASTLGGWARARLGDGEQGLAQLRAALDNYRATGAGLFEPWSLGLLADVHAAAGRPEQALAALDSALASPLLVADAYFYAAALHCHRGELLHTLNGDAEQARACLRKALELAQRQGAKLFERRAAERLAVLG